MVRCSGEIHTSIQADKDGQAGRAGREENSRKGGGFDADKVLHKLLNIVKNLQYNATTSLAISL
jgi:hypothetical protein